MDSSALGIYIHVPYCIRKCRYCDFVSFERAPQETYFAKLAEDIKSAKNAIGDRKQCYVDTVFFGGGTPSLASKEQLGAVLDAIREKFGIADGAELSIEVNPETVTEQKAAELKELGFTRVSMGVQSLDDGVLSALGRIHSADRARKAYHTLRDAGFENINLDLMFGTPRETADGSRQVQDLEVWHHTLDEIFAMKPQHISFYSLQVEEDTPLWSDYKSGKADLPSWEENREMYHSAAQLLKEHGYRHYEVSNAALPGFECRHNIKYWTMQPYMGFGISAHSFLPELSEEGRLVFGYRGEADWAATDPFADLQKESITDLKGDFLFTQLRLTDGLDTGLYRQLFRKEFAEEFAGPLEKLVSGGFLKSQGDHIALTEKGLDSTNPVMQELLYALL